MPEKILYYIGAGASVNALPLAKSVVDSSEMPPEVVIPGLLHELEHFSFNSMLVGIPSSDDQIIIEDSFKSLAKKANEFGDVDTYAKYLFLKGQLNDFELLKRTISQYFAIKQLLQRVSDKRYLQWLVSIMDKSRFPENVKILSWNYDFQIELAATQFGPLVNVDHKGNSFSYSPSWLLHYPNLDPTFSDYQYLSLIHLNGIAGFARMGDMQRASVFQINYKTPDEIISFLKGSSLHSHLHFAWEKSGYHDKLMEHVRSMVMGTTIMVVIGYSFPFFNREVDKQVLNDLKRQTSFRKIYFQNPVLSGEQLKAQFELDETISIVHIKDVDSFYIPFEF